MTKYACILRKKNSKKTPSEILRDAASFERVACMNVLTLLMHKIIITHFNKILKRIKYI